MKSDCYAQSVGQMYPILFLYMCMKGAKNNAFSANITFRMFDTHLY